MAKTMVRQAVPLQPMEDDGEQRFHLQPVEDPTAEQVETPEGGCDPMGSPPWRKLLAGPVAPWRGEPMPEQGDLSEVPGVVMGEMRLEKTQEQKDGGVQ
ncbi:AN1-type zinc finger protein 5-like [Grus japonensis]|uniref:AN1-type zinc finger protein 5-like n=1 Tax=Grus japonensis TaxID=30415 RepID=A0ABC9WR81_GRUJA